MSEPIGAARMEGERHDADRSSENDSDVEAAQIEEALYGFLIDWDFGNLDVFVQAANRLPVARAPWWLQTLPPHITMGSFPDDVMRQLESVAGGRLGHVMLSSNTPEQLYHIARVATTLEAHEFVQQALNSALPIVNGVDPSLATIYCLPCTQIARPLRLAPVLRGPLPPLRRMFA